MPYERLKLGKLDIVGIAVMIGLLNTYALVRFPFVWCWWAAFDGREAAKPKLWSC